MADCFSLPKVVELVEGLRRHIKLSREGRIYVDIGSEVFCRQAADTIEQLLAENEKLKAERDAAFEDLKFADKKCRRCKWYDKNYANWEWRGVKEEENETD